MLKFCSVSRLREIESQKRLRARWWHEWIRMNGHLSDFTVEKRIVRGAKLEAGAQLCDLSCNQARDERGLDWSGGGGFGEEWTELREMYRLQSAGLGNRRAALGERGFRSLGDWENSFAIPWDRKQATIAGVGVKMTFGGKLRLTDVLKRHPNGGVQ